MKDSSTPIGQEARHPKGLPERDRAVITGDGLPHFLDLAEDTE